MESNENVIIAKLINPYGGVGMPVVATCISVGRNYFQESKNMISKLIIILLLIAFD